MFVTLSAAGNVLYCAPSNAYASSQTFLPWPYFGQSAIGVVGEPTIYSHDITSPLPMASTAKIVTALVVLQKYPLNDNQNGPMIEFTKNDVDRYYYYQDLGGSILPVVEGQSMSEYDALRSMLIPSANNIADALAIWAYGSLDAYSDAAARYLSEHRLQGTNIGNDASGFSPSSTSTATDLVKIGKIVLDNKVLAKIVRMQTADIAGLGTVTNTNKLLGKNGVIGIKTGNSNSDKGVYLFATNQILVDGSRITSIGAIMGAPSMDQAFSDALPLAAFVSQAQVQ